MWYVSWTPTYIIGTRERSQKFFLPLLESSICRVQHIERFVSCRCWWLRFRGQGRCQGCVLDILCVLRGRDDKVCVVEFDWRWFDWPSCRGVVGVMFLRITTAFPQGTSLIELIPLTGTPLALRCMSLTVLAVLLCHRQSNVRWRAVARVR